MMNQELKGYLEEVGFFIILSINYNLLLANTSVLISGHVSQQCAFM